MNSKTITSNSINKLFKNYEKKAVEYDKLDSKLKKIKEEMLVLCKEIAMKQISTINKKKSTTQKKKLCLYDSDTESNDVSDSN